jgi:hypothetical protein
MDITVDIQHRSPAGRPVRRVPHVPWSPRAWGQAISLAGGIPVQLAPWLVPFLLVRWAEVSSGGRWQWQGWLFWYLLTAAVMLLLVPVFTRVQRHRLRAAGVVIPPQPKRGGLLRPGGITAALRAQATWRQVAYHLLAAPALAGAAAAAIGVWLAGAVFGLVYVYAWCLRPSDNMLYRATYGSTASTTRLASS